MLGRRSFPFGAKGLVSGVNLLLVSGRVKNHLSSEIVEVSFGSFGQNRFREVFLMQVLLFI